MRPNDDAGLIAKSEFTEREFDRDGAPQDWQGAALPGRLPVQVGLERGCVHRLNVLRVRNN